MHRSAPLPSLLLLALIGGGVAVALAGTHPILALVVVGLGGVAGLAVRLTFRALPSIDTKAIEEAQENLERRLEYAASERHRMRLRAETASRFREDFVAAVRHELKTPLNAILGFSDVLLQDVDGPLNPQQKEDVEAIQAAGVYLRELVDSVLSEWVPDDTPALLRRMAVTDLVRDVARLVRGQLAGKSVELFVLVHDEGLEVIGDPRRMRQILINLATNAIRATERGSVSIEARRDGAHVRLTVRDTGPGIPDEDVPHLFTEFVQSGPEDSRLGGSGLGLALTRDMVEWHDGRVHVETEVGVGSAFHVLLPGDLD